MPKKELGSMFSNVDLTQAAPPAEAVTEAPTKAPARKRSAQSKARPAPAPAKSAARPPGRPAMLAGVGVALQRREIQLEAGQSDALDLLVKALNRVRDKSAEGTEPITASGLLRIAAAVLLEKGGSLAGDNEAELLESYRQALQGG